MTARHRLLVTALVLVTITISIVQIRGARLAGFTSVASYSFPGGALYSGALALVLAWVGPSRSDVRVGAFLMGGLALFLSLVLVPSRDAGLVHQLTFAASWLWLLLLVRFGCVFPSTLNETLIHGSARGVTGRVQTAVLSVQRVILTRRAAWALMGALVAAWSVAHVFWFASSTYLIAGSGPVGDYPAWYLVLEILVIGLPGIALSFLWTGYRIADGKRRQRALVVVLFWTLAILWGLIGILMVFMPLPAFAESAVTYFWAAFYPVGLFLVVTGMGTGVLYSGAFDVSPLLSRATIYGGLLLCLSVLFAIVEEAAQSILTSQLGLPDGAGTIAGAVVVALAIAPLHARLQKSLGALGAKAGEETSVGS
jgi:hypothetical protein